MACGCSQNECIDVYLDACAASITLDIEATETGTYQMMVEFNGANIRRAITVTNGENITVPNVFNLDYTHTIKFYKPDGTVLNNTCYKLRTMPTIFPNASDTPVEAGDQSVNVTADADSDTLTSAEMEGKTVIAFLTDNQAYNTNFTQTGDELTRTDGGSFYTGQTVTLIFG